MILITRKASPAAFAAGGRNGFIFPLAVGLVCVLLILGAMFLMFTVHSKNVSFSFMLDDLALTLAESAVAEGRFRFKEALKGNSELKHAIANFEPDSGPSDGSLPFRFALDNLPLTREVADNLLGRGNVKIEGIVRLHHVRRDFPPVLMGNGSRVDMRFQGEFQAILRFDFTVALDWGKQTQKSRFAFEFDFKHACLRSRPEGRETRGYPTTLTNDYALFIRDGFEEFAGRFAETLNGPKFGVEISSPGGKTGKVYFGSRELLDPGRKLFFNLPETLAGLIPPPPPPVVFSWAELCQLLPTLTTTIESKIRAQLPPKAQALVPKILNSFSGNLAVEYFPMVGYSPQGWMTTCPPWKQKAYFGYFSRCSKAYKRFPVLSPEVNPLPLTFRFNGREFDPSVTLEGDLRKRFWVSSTWWLTTSYDEKLKTEIEKKTLILVERFLPEELAAKTPEIQEVQAMVAGLEKKCGEVLTTGPHDLYLFGDRTPKVPEGGFPRPPAFERLGNDGMNNLRPLGSIFLRSYDFPRAQEFYASPLVNRDDRNVVHFKLPGFVSVRKAIQIPAGAKFHGKGMLYSNEGMVIEGDFQPANPEDGPCVLFSDCGRLTVGTQSDGPICASLVAMGFSFPGLVSGIYCPKGNLNVVGNVVTDRIWFTEGTKAPVQPTGKFRIAYDAPRLSGNGTDEYISFVGGLLRRMGAVMSVQ